LRSRGRRPPLSKSVRRRRGSLGSRTVASKSITASKPSRVPAVRRSQSFTSALLLPNAGAHLGRAAPVPIFVADFLHLAPTEACAVAVALRWIASIGRVVRASAGAGAGKGDKTAAQGRAGSVVSDGYANRGGLAFAGIRLTVATADRQINVGARLWHPTTSPVDVDAGTPVGRGGCAELATRTRDAVGAGALTALQRVVCDH
jgi:hypothetical protein